MKGRVGVADPLRVCGDLLNPQRLRGRIAILERGDCMFVEKVCESFCCVSGFEPCMNVFVLSGVGNVVMCLRLNIISIGNVSENI